MLQYLTDDLLLGYGLPKKRMTASIGYQTLSLNESVLTCDSSIPLGSQLQRDNIVAIGRDNRVGLLLSLHTDATVNVVGIDRSRELMWDTLHIFLI
jgi:hypothetical protein